MLAPATFALALLATQAAAQRTQSVWGQCENPPPVPLPSFFLVGFLPRYGVLMLSLAGGGRGYTGPTACQTGSQCKSQNEWYSQCLGNSNSGGSQQGGGNDWEEGDEETWEEGDETGDEGYEEYATVVSTVRGSNGNGGQVTRVITTVFSVGPQGGGGGGWSNTAGRGQGQGQDQGQNRGGVTIVRSSRWLGQGSPPAPTPQTQQRPGGGNNRDNAGATPRTTIRRADGYEASPSQSEEEPIPEEAPPADGAYDGSYDQGTTEEAPQ